MAAKSKIAPDTISLSAADAPERSRPFPSDPITNAPKIAFQTEPRPPKSEVPPITAAPIASRRSEPPAKAVYETDPYLEAPKIPPIAAIKPTIANAETLILLIFIPTLLALSALPPTAKMDLP